LESQVEIDDAVPMIDGHHDALARRALECDAERGGRLPQCAMGRRSNHRPSAPRADSPRRDAVEIAVRDTGCGIAPSSCRASGIRTSRPNPAAQGLGLAIARQTVVAHDGNGDGREHVGRGNGSAFRAAGERQPAMETEERWELTA
jgi:signal transduction histidine kinase